MNKPVIIGNATLFCGDCLDILPSLNGVDAVVTDPPYGIGITKSNRLATSRGMGGKQWDDAPMDGERCAKLLAAAPRAIIWGGNYFDLPPARCFLVWDKLNDGRDFADIEFAWTNIDAVARIYRFRPMNMDGGKVHPTQKPVDLMGWCLRQLPGARVICDPFMGSGSTGVACAKAGLSFIGIERDPDYFRVACNRLREAANDLFVAPQKPVQAPLFGPEAA